MYELLLVSLQASLAIWLNFKAHLMGIVFMVYVIYYIDHKLYKLHILPRFYIQVPTFLLQSHISRLSYTIFVCRLYWRSSVANILHHYLHFANF